jgi:hypothetical protein
MGQAGTQVMSLNKLDEDGFVKKKSGDGKHNFKVTKL